MQLIFFVLKLLFVAAAFVLLGPFVGACCLVIAVMGGEQSR